jgi:hypothetical protein
VSSVVAVDWPASDADDLVDLAVVGDGVEQGVGDVGARDQVPTGERGAEVGLTTAIRRTPVPSIAVTIARVTSAATPASLRRRAPTQEMTASQSATALAKVAGSSMLAIADLPQCRSWKFPS